MRTIANRSIVCPDREVYQWGQCFLFNPFRTLHPLWNESLYWHHRIPWYWRESCREECGHFPGLPKRTDRHDPLEDHEMNLVGCDHLKGLPRWFSGKESACQCRRRRFDPWVRKIPWRRKWQSTPVFLPGESRGQRSLAGYSPWGDKESDITEHACMITLKKHKQNRKY